MLVEHKGFLHKFKKEMSKIVVNNHKIVYRIETLLIPPIQPDSRFFFLTHTFLIQNIALTLVTESEAASV
jgi:hypothetical protein